MGWSPGDLNKYFIGFDHSQLAARFFLDHLQPFFQVTHFGGQLVDAGLRISVFDQLLIKLLLQITYVGHTAPANPKLRMKKR